MLSHLDKKVRDCAIECGKCYQECESTTTHCLLLGGKHANPDHIMMLLDCAAICKASEGFLLRGSRETRRICELCIDICELCADSCEKIDEADPHMMSCAEECRKCAEACRAM